MSWRPGCNIAPNTGKHMPYPAESHDEKICREEREVAARRLEVSPAAIRLMAGELTAQEMRTVQAVLAAKAAEIRRNDPVFHQKPTLPKTKGWIEP